ncbi:MAG: hypothetical protein EOP06_13295 [Proteobacteria bacterium]|nr:MAG: hypothetical protein EOP06_13295 [Pseudomonadota bacterium]
MKTSSKKLFLPILALATLLLALLHLSGSSKTTSQQAPAVKETSTVAPASVRDDAPQAEGRS